eukprot:SAG31_NODE_808_length_11926_cov_13.255179_10_plen_1339_part_00
MDEIEKARQAAMTDGDDMRATRIMEYALFVRSRSDEVSERGLAEFFEELTTAYNSLAMENVESGNHSLAQELLRKAEFVTEQRDVLINSDLRLKLRAITLNNMGCLYRRRGKLHAAVKFLEKALRIERTLADLDDPASTHLNLCATLSEMGRHETAAGHGEQALLYLLRKLGLPPQSSVEQIPEEKADVAHILAVAYYNLGTEQEALGRFEDALSSMSCATAVADRFWDKEDETGNMLRQRTAQLKRRVGKSRDDAPMTLRMPPRPPPRPPNTGRTTVRLGTARSGYVTQPTSARSLGQRSITPRSRKRPQPQSARSAPRLPKNDANVPFALRLGTPPTIISKPALTEAELRIVKAHARHNTVKALRSAPAKPTKPSSPLGFSTFGAKTADAGFFGSTREFGPPTGDIGGFARLVTPRELPPIGVQTPMTVESMSAKPARGGSVLSRTESDASPDYMRPASIEQVPPALPPQQPRDQQRPSSRPTPFIRTSPVFEASESETKQQPTNEEMPTAVPPLVDDVDLEGAATRIQAVHRGKAARTQVTRQRSHAVERRVHSDRNNAAATQLQCAQRQKIARAEAARRRHARAAAEESERLHLDATEESELERVLADEAVGQQVRLQAHVDAENVEAEIAATRIQSRHRGRAARQHVRQRRAQKQSMPVVAVIADDVDEWNDAEYEALQAKLQQKRMELQERMSRLEGQAEERAARFVEMHEHAHGSSLQAQVDDARTNAAIRIQASHRGKAVRTQMSTTAPSAAAGSKEVSATPNPAPVEEEMVIPQFSHSQSVAQAQLMSRINSIESTITRLQDKLVVSEAAGPQSDEARIEELMAVPASPTERKRIETLVDADTSLNTEKAAVQATEEELASAALQIQAVQRGNAARKELKEDPSSAQSIVRQTTASADMNSAATEDVSASEPDPAPASAPEVANEATPVSTAVSEPEPGPADAEESAVTSSELVEAATEAEVGGAALKIQAVQRGNAARKKVDGLKADATPEIPADADPSCEPSSEPTSEPEASIVAESEPQTAVEAEIQSSIPAAVPEAAEPETGKPESAAPAVVPEAPISDVTTDVESGPADAEESAVTSSELVEAATEAEVSEAALKIQAVQRGNAARKKVDGLKADATPEIPADADPSCKPSSEPTSEPEASIVAESEPQTAVEAEIQSSIPAAVPEALVPDVAPEGLPEAAVPEATPAGQPEGTPEVGPHVAPEATPEAAEPETGKPESAAPAVVPEAPVSDMTADVESGPADAEESAVTSSELVEAATEAEVSEAALKIQAVQRGNAARKKVDGPKTDEEPLAKPTDTPRHVAEESDAKESAVVETAEPPLNR